MAANPPPTLRKILQDAANKYGVPYDTLVGIWRIESRSSYPNPYANGLGYGGILGTQITQPFGSAKDTRFIANAPSPQQQADTAASILARLLRNSGGNMAIALKEYSGGGYSSVAGGPSGTVPIPSAAPTVLGGQSTPTVQLSAPRSRGGSSITSTLDDWAHDIAGGAVEGGKDVAHGLGWSSAWSGITDTAGALKGIAGFFLMLTDPATWLRAIEFVVGIAAMVLGIIAILLDSKTVQKGAAFVGKASIAGKAAGRTYSKISGGSKK